MSPLIILMAILSLSAATAANVIGNCRDSDGAIHRDGEQWVDKEEQVVVGCIVYTNSSWAIKVAGCILPSDGRWVGVYQRIIENNRWWRCKPKNGRVSLE